MADFGFHQTLICFLSREILRYNTNLIKYVGGAAVRIKTKHKHDAKEKSESCILESKEQLEPRYSYGPYEVSYLSKDIEKEAKKGDVDAQAKMGWYYYKNKEYKKAFDCFQKAEKQEDTCRKVVMSGGGDSSTSDEEGSGAIDHSDFGSVKCGLAYCYYYGHGVVKEDKDIAFLLFTEAALMDDYNGQYALGFCYEHGIGTKQDRMQALVWYEKVQHFFKKAKKRLDKLKEAAVSEVVTRDRWLLRKYFDSLNKPKISGRLVRSMFAMVKNLDQFKLPYTLANIKLRQYAKDKEANRTKEEAIKKSVYQCLEGLITICIVKHNEKKEDEQFIKQYREALDDAFSKKFINKEQKRNLKEKALEEKIKESVFNDKRFTALQREVQALKGEVISLKGRVGIVEDNVTVLAKDLNNLKKALEVKEKRQLASAIAKAAVGFLASPIVDLVTNVFDFSDISKLGITVLKIKEDEWRSLVAKGADTVKGKIEDTVVKGALKKMDCDPDELIDLWVKATINLNGTEPPLHHPLVPSGLFASGPQERKKKQNEESDTDEQDELFAQAQKN